MAKEKENAPASGGEPKPAGEGKKKKGKLLIVLILGVLIATGGGVYGYLHFVRGKEKASGETHKPDQKLSLFSLDPFVVNLAEPGRYLKVTIQLEMEDPSQESIVTEKVPILRDAIITLIGSQSYEYAASPEGKMQIKDDILLRANNAVGKKAFRNIYFTDFVMQ